MVIVKEIYEFLFVKIFGMNYDVIVWDFVDYVVMFYVCVGNVNYMKFFIVILFIFNIGKFLWSFVFYNCVVINDDVLDV